MRIFSFLNLMIVLRCLLEAEEALGDCILHNCDEGDDDCLATCEENFEIQYHDCPCQLNCPNGCPCKSFDCDPAGSHGVLIFSRDMGRDSDAYIPKLVNFRGVESEGKESSNGKKSLTEVRLSLIKDSH